MNQQANKAMVSEIYNSLAQLITAYERVMDTFGSVVGDVIHMKKEIGDIEEFVNSHVVDLIQARDIWQANAKIHKERADEMRVKLQILAAQGHKIEAEIVLPAKGSRDERDSI